MIAAGFASGVASANTLARGEVCVWMLSSSGAGRHREALLAHLLPEERVLWQRMRAGTAADDFLTGRACLRLLLGAALGRSLAGVSLTAGPHGKPATAGIEFNVSHSHGQVAIALCRDAAVGIDLEWMNPAVEAVEVASANFAPAEVACIVNAGTGGMAAFYRCWTRKEAVVKAHGQGLTLPLAAFTVNCAEDDREHEVALPGQSLWVRGLPTPVGYAAALAVTQPEYTVRLFQL